MSMHTLSSHASDECMAWKIACPRVLWLRTILKFLRRIVDGCNVMSPKKEKPAPRAPGSDSWDSVHAWKRKADTLWGMVLCVCAKIEVPKMTVSDTLRSPYIYIHIYTPNVPRLRQNHDRH